jgi:hypothetical protein
MTQHTTFLKFLLDLFHLADPDSAGTGEPQIQVQRVLQMTQSWDGVNYQSYPTGQPQLTVLRIKVPNIVHVFALSSQ